MSRTQRSVITDRWQITIPSAVRMALGLKPRQRLTYELREGGVLIRPEPEGVSELYGRLKSEVPPASKAQERDAVRAARVSRYQSGS